MRTRSAIGSLSSLILALFAAGPASAATFEVLFPILAVEGEQASFFTVGNTMTISFETDDGVPDSNVTDGLGSYLSGLLSLSIDFGAGSTELSTGTDVGNFYTTADDQGGFGVFLDNIFLSANGNQSGDIDGIPLFQLSVSMTEIHPTTPPSLVVSEAVGPAPLAPTEVFVSVVTFDPTVPSVLPKVTLINFNVVPEPGTATLLASAALGTLALRRRH